MKRYFAAYEPVATESILVFTIIVRDELVARSALLAMRDKCPHLRWTERGGWFVVETHPLPPFEFLPSAI